MRLRILAACWITACAPPPPEAAVEPPEVERPIPLTEWEEVVPPGCAAIDEIGATFSLEAPLFAAELVTKQLLALRAAPEAAGCVEAESAAVLDRMGAPVSSAIRQAALLLDEPVEVPPYGAVDFERGLAAVCGATECGASSGEVPEELARALGPVLLAIAGGLEARAERESSQARGGRGADWWRDHTGNGLIFDPEGEGYDTRYPPDRSYLTGGRGGIYGAAARIAHAIEAIDWSPFAGRRGVRFDLETEAGAIRVRDGNDDVYRESEPTLLLVDLGGRDVHRDEVASNLSGKNAVNIVIDLAGDDDYGYDGDDIRFTGNDRFGPISLSSSFRQGAARNGIAMLFDLGGNDRYRSLRGSQGYAHQGVGVLFDGDGDDRYESEAVSQGAAQFGIGLLIDLGGRDEYRSVFASQGFGFVAAVGIAYDAAGDDRWSCDAITDGDLYRSPQLPGRASTSLCQGAGFGMRSDDPAIAMSGGLGVLRDSAGDDDYAAGVYAQGVGYWQGVGVLSEGDGNDRYDSLYYAQGSGVHHAAGVLVDHAGDDVRGGMLRPENLSIGAGYDFSVGVLFDLDGRDELRFAGLSVGAASENALGLYYDRAGDDRYLGPLPGRAARGGRARMIDESGDDTYEP